MKRILSVATVSISWLCLTVPAVAAERTARTAAIESITTVELKRHVDVLADDTYEGREAGSRGGRAAAGYLVQQLKQLGCQGGGADGGFYQPFDASSANVLALLVGSDPQLKSQFVVASAHFDHVGYGNRRNSFGPVGLIHNGADDNASGVAGLLEVIDAFGKFGDRPKRSILFAFWDGEEKGLLGSKHWLERPTVRPEQVAALVNADMIGRLREGRVEVSGSRTAHSLRRLVSTQNQDNLLLNFTWEMSENSDHYPFYAHGIPVLMLHTGLHPDYHRPSDDADKINHAGLQQVARLMFNVVLELADRPEQESFRAAARGESPAHRSAAEQPIEPLPGRLGVSFVDAATGEAGVLIKGVHPGSPAERAELRAGDRIVRFASRGVTSADELMRVVLGAPSETVVAVRRGGDAEPREVKVSLRGTPIRVGISWRVDEAEPSAVTLCLVVPGSPAAAAGLHVFDRVYRIGQHDVAGTEQLSRLLDESSGPTNLLVETGGRLRTATLDLPPLEPPRAQ